MNLLKNPAHTLKTNRKKVCDSFLSHVAYNLSSTIRLITPTNYTYRNKGLEREKRKKLPSIHWISIQQKQFRKDTKKLPSIYWISIQQ